MGCRLKLRWGLLWLFPDPLSACNCLTISASGVFLVAPTRWQYSSRLISTIFEKRVALKELFEHILNTIMSTTRILCAVLMVTIRIWMMLSFVFCFPLFMGLLSIRMCFWEYCRAKQLMYNSVWQEWMSFVTPLRGREGDLVRFMSLLCVKQVHFGEHFGQHPCPDIEPV